jgi:hypothetical protein
MKFFPVVLSLLAAIAGFVSAYIWKRASNAGGPDYSGLGTEPGTHESRQGYHMLAMWLGTAKSGKLNEDAAYWAGAAAALSLVLAAMSLWLLFSN